MSKTFSGCCFAGAILCGIMAVAPHASARGNSAPNSIAEGARVLATTPWQHCVDQYGEGLRDECTAAYGSSLLGGTHDAGNR